MDKLKLPCQGQREWTVEHWEGQDYVICQYGEPIGRTLSKQDANILLKWLESMTEKPKKNEMKTKILGFNKNTHDFVDNWECPNCKCKYTKQDGDCPAGNWWTACARCGKKVH